MRQRDARPGRGAVRLTVDRALRGAQHRLASMGLLIGCAFLFSISAPPPVGERELSSIDAG